MERGKLAREYRDLEYLGQGAFGKVWKAIDTANNQPYALKLVPVQLREHQTVDDSHGAWCGLDTFRQLQRMRSKHLMHYYDAWTELPEDIPGSPEAQLVKTADVGSKPKRNEGGDIGACGRDGADVDELDLSTAPFVADSKASGDGFDWETSSGTGDGDGGDGGKGRTGDEEIDSRIAMRRRKSSKDWGRKYDVMMVIKMEYIEGIELAKWLADPSARRGMTGGTFDDALELFAQLMSGLAELHMLGMVHRDVKPANVMVSPKDGVLKIIDFGLARPKEIPSKPNPWARQCSNEPETLFTVVGTPGYAPPEQCTQMCPNESSDDASAAVAASDIFSAGVILVELLLAAASGGPPWRTAMERANIFNQARGGFNAGLPGMLTKECPLPGWLRQLVVRMTHVEAVARPTAREVLEELRAGTMKKEKHNPYVGSSRHASPSKLVKLGRAACLGQNPYIGFFLEHRSRTFEVAF